MTDPVLILEARIRDALAFSSNERYQNELNVVLDYFSLNTEGTITALDLAAVYNVDFFRLAEVLSYLKRQGVILREEQEDGTYLYSLTHSQVPVYND